MCQYIVCIVLIFVTDGTAADGDVDVAATLREVSIGVESFFGVAIVAHRAITIFIFVKQSVAHGRQSSAAINGTEYRAALDVQIDTTGHVTSSQSFTTETTSTTEHMTVIIGGASGSNLRTCLSCLTNGHRDITQHMAILTSAINGTVDSTALNLNNGILHVCIFIEEYTLVTLTTTEEITCDRMIDNISISARYTNCTIGHHDGSRSIHIGGFTTAIDIGQDMSASDGHICITSHLTCAHDISTLTL